MHTHGLLASAAALSALALGVSPAAAQTPRTMVEASALIQGMPGPPTHQVGPLYGEPAAVAEIDAGPIVWNNYLRTVAGVAHGRSLAQLGGLDVEIAAAGDKRDSTQFPNYGPGASSAARFKDSAVVLSGLPAGTPVTLTFRVDTRSLATASGNGVASSTCNFTVNGSTSTANWSFSSLRSPAPAPIPAITVNTRVGNRMSFDGTLRLTGSVPWIMQGSPSIGGELAASAHCGLVLEAASAPVTLLADSGHDYGTPVL
ncbi:hypothetical protein WME79_24575 [Sorangium sp. So ce726]|uniref:hypothetical protein n=1 Tax=Sorangium sp. So ce726 TaxID=3133319 RepID=UPI003F62C757